MAYTPVRPTDPLDNPSHSGLHNQHATDLEALQAFRELFAGGDAGEVLAKTTNDDYDIEWLPGGTGGGDGGDYPGISSEDPNGLGLGTDGGLRVEPADLLSDNEGQQLKVAADDGKLHMAYDIVDAVPEDDDTTYSIGDVVFVTGPGDGGSSPVGGGKVLQVVRETDSTIRSTNSADYVDVTGMSITITPQKPDSAIIVIAAFNAEAGIDGPSQTALYALTDSSNNALSGAEQAQVGRQGINHAGAETGYIQSYVSLFGYSKPATTSATTYKLRFAIEWAGSGAMNFVRNDLAIGQMYALEISA